jgi:hypothetical protein
MKETPIQTQTPTIPKTAFDALNVYFNTPYVTTILKPQAISVQDTRKPMINKVNQILGEKIADINDLISLTAKKGLIIQWSSWGSIFEAWIRARFFVSVGASEEVKKANEADLASKKKLLNEGKARFYLTVSSNGTRTIAPEGEVTVNKRIIDCSYQEPNMDNPTCTTVCVEIKHTQGKLEGDPLTQFQDNVKLVRAKRIKRIEYIFSTEAAAIDNQNLFLPPNLISDPNADNSTGFRPNEREDLFRVFFIDKNGIKQLVNYSKK